MRPTRVTRSADNHQPHRQQGLFGPSNFRNRIKANSVDNADADRTQSKANGPVSPTEAFFARSYPLQNQLNNPKPPLSRVAQNHKHLQRLPEEPEHQSTLHALQETRSPLGQELLAHVVANSNDLCNSATASLMDTHNSLQKELSQVTTQNYQLLNLLDNNHRRFDKPLSETFIGDEQGVKVQIGKYVASFKSQLHTAENELESLWFQWEASQNEVDSILGKAPRGQEDSALEETEATRAVEESFASEMEALSNELDALLHHSHEDARLSEKNYSKKIHGIMSALLQRYLLED